MLVVDNPTVEQVLTVPEVIDALEECHRALASGEAVNAPNYRVFTPRDGKDYGPRFPQGGHPTHHAFTSLTGSIATLDVTSDRVDSDIITYVKRDGRLREIRVPGTHDRKFCGMIYLYSSKTGELLSIIHDGYLQKFRVAGTAAIGTKYLARKDAKVMGLIGTGWQAQAQVLCQAAVRKLDKIKVYSPTPGNAAAFAKRWAAEAGVEIEPAASAREACKGSDFIITATNAPEAVVMADWLEPGQFITGVKDVELEMAGWERCDPLVVNRMGAFWQRYAIGGTDIIPEQGRDHIGRTSKKINWDNVPLLGDVMLGKHPGRTSDEQITGMILAGDGVQFTAVGARVYKLCKERGLGVDLPRELFLQDEKYIP
jgi:ornithine cyclodeaminase/alanine dehydrogenase-like protein (mu-crystallin family)